MRYKVLKPFYDKEDNLQAYGIGGLYPRESVEVDEDRLDHLAGLGFIEVLETVEADEADEEIETNEPMVEMTDRNTKQEIMDHLDDLEIDYKTSETKKDLLALLDDSNEHSN